MSKLPHPFGEHQMRELERCVKELKQRLRVAPWDDDPETVVTMDRRGRTLKIGVMLFVGDEPVYQCWSSINKFLDATTDTYGCGSEGWGDRLIQDLEELQRRIGKRIALLRKQRDNDESPAGATP
jgi:hypothetical protein